MRKIFPYNQTQTRGLTATKHLSKCLCQATAHYTCPTSSFLDTLSLFWIGITFFPPPSSFLSLHSHVCVISHHLISLSLFYLYPIIPPSCWLADLNLVLFWSSALGETNSLWLFAATHILSCPSALTVCMRQKEGGGGGLKREKDGGQIQRETL